MNKELYILKCPDCLQTFRTDDPDKKVCPSCEKYRKPHRPGGRGSRKKKILTFAEIDHIANVYHKIHHTYLKYGQIVLMVEQNKGRCVCCGATIAKSKQICSKCEGGNL